MNPELPTPCDQIVHKVNNIKLTEKENYFIPFIIHI